MSARPLRLLVFDRTCRGGWLRPGLSHAWAAGRHLYGALGRLDDARGVASWAEALDWLGGVSSGAPIAEIQFWGHGRWGRVLVGGEALDVGALAPGHPHHDRLCRVRERLLPGDAGLWWFRTCETFGTAAGHGFARAWTRFFRCRAAGHTYVIGAWQSGLHALRPGEEPRWSLTEGLPPGQVDPPLAARSGPGKPNTITCFHGRIPEGF
jgi:hypothetical protein